MELSIYSGGKASVKWVENTAFTPGDNWLKYVSLAIVVIYATSVILFEVSKLLYL